MPIFTHVSSYPHPRSEVFAWHTRPGGFVRLTPPGMATLLAGPTNGIEVGSELRLKISDPVLNGLLGVGLPWLVRHVELVPGERFVDEQVRGPLKSWRHEHLFADAPGGGTTITDRVTWEPPVPAPRFVLDLITGRLAAMFAFREAQLRDDLDFHARLDAPASHVVVTGASGLIGTQVCALLTTGGHRVTRLVRSPKPGPGEASWDPAAGRLDAAVFDGVDAVVHLAGASIAGRFTASHKRAILDSRVDGTTTLARALAGSGVRTLAQASGIGVYGPRRPSQSLGDDALPGTGFLAEVVEAWEAAAAPASEAGVRTAFLRTGIVLSGGGGALLPQLPLFLVGAGGRLTAPDAWLSWIGLDDMARAYAHALFTPTLAGPVNAVVPEPATASGFAATLGRVLHRPALLPTPPFGPRLVLGREGADQLIETDQRVLPEKLTASGFRWYQPTLDAALRHALLR